MTCPLDEEVFCRQGASCKGRGPQIKEVHECAYGMVDSKSFIVHSYGAQGVTGNVTGISLIRGYTHDSTRESLLYMGEIYPLRSTGDLQSW